MHPRVVMVTNSDRDSAITLDRTRSSITVISWNDPFDPRGLAGWTRPWAGPGLGVLARRGAPRPWASLPVGPFAPAAPEAGVNLTADGEPSDAQRRTERWGRRRDRREPWAGARLRRVVGRRRRAGGR